MDAQLDFDAELRRRRAAEPLLVASEVAQMLRVTTAWVYEATRANRVPHVRLGRYVRYRESAVLAWLAEEEARSAREPRG